VSSAAESAPAVARKRGKPEPYRLRLVRFDDGGVARKMFAAAGEVDRDRLGKLKLQPGDYVYAHITKPRNESFHRLAHAIGKMVVENIPGFEHLTAHEALKRLQLESGSGCETVMVQAHTIWPSICDWVEKEIGKPMAIVLRGFVSALCRCRMTVLIRLHFIKLSKASVIILACITGQPRHLKR
jgi:hypothetical protein